MLGPQLRVHPSKAAEAARSVGEPDARAMEERSTSLEKARMTRVAPIIWNQWPDRIELLCSDCRKPVETAPGSGLPMMLMNAAPTLDLTRLAAMLPPGSRILRWTPGVLSSKNPKKRYPPPDVYFLLCGGCMEVFKGETRPTPTTEEEPEA